MVVHVEGSGGWADRLRYLLLSGMVVLKQQTQAVEWRAAAIPLTRQTTVTVLGVGSASWPHCVGPRLHFLLPLVLLPPRSGPLAQV